VGTRLIINLRGPNGAGKTTVARGFLEHKTIDLEPYRYINSEGRSRSWPIAQCKAPGLQLPIYVLGRYDVQQGGCDTEKDMDAIERCVQWAVDNLTDGHIFFEGFVVFKSGGRWLEFAGRNERAGKGRYVWAFLRPNLNELEARIKGRNGGKEVKLPLLDNTMRTVDLIRNKAKALVTDRRFLVDLDWQLSAPMVTEQLILRLQQLEAVR